MSLRILCPKHEERTPSCQVYASGWAHCFGCGANFKYVDGETGELPPPPEPEDLAASFTYILDLPRQSVRGLNFPADKEAYYVVWPDLDYYKKRYFLDRRCKYIGASGHSMPWFWVRREGFPLVIVEGEINALSIAEACPELAVVSPGGAGDFLSKKVKKYLQILVQYSTVVVVADADAPGAKAVIELYGELVARGLTVKTLLMQEDANSVLVSRGRQVLREEIQRAVAGDMDTSTTARKVSPQ